MTLLCLSSGVGVEGAVELAGDVALEDAADVAVGFAFGAAAGEVGMGAGAAAHPGERDGVQGVVEVPVAAAVEAVADGFAAAGGDGVDAGEGGEGGLLRQRPGWDQDTMVCAALTGPTPGRSSRPGARSVMMAASWSRLWVRSRWASRMAWASRRVSARRVACSRVSVPGPRRRMSRSSQSWVTRPRDIARSVSSPVSSRARSWLICRVYVSVSSARA